MASAPPPSEEFLAAHRAHRENRAELRTFTVVGAHKVAGKSRGETVQLLLTQAEADHLILAGHIQELGFHGPPPEPEAAEVVSLIKADPIPAATRGTKRVSHSRKV